MDLSNYNKRLFLASALIACLTCYARADYNLPLFAFAYLLWDYQKQGGGAKSGNQKVRLMYLIVFTFIVDFVWLIYYGAYWHQAFFQGNWASGVQSFVYWLSLINFLLKIAVMVSCVQQDPEVRRAIEPQVFWENFCSLFREKSDSQVNSSIGSK